MHTKRRFHQKRRPAYRINSMITFQMLIILIAAVALRGICAEIETINSPLYTIPPGYSKGVTSVDVFMDDSRILTGSGDGVIVFWDRSSLEMIRMFFDHEGGVTSLAISVDESKFLSGSGDNSAKLWDLETGEVISRFEGHLGAVNSVAFSPKGEYILTGSNDETAKLWDITNSAVIRTFSGHEDSVNSAVFSPDGTHVITGSKDKTVRIWNLEQPNKPVRIIEHPGSTNEIEFSPDGTKFLTCGQNAVLWEWNSGKPLHEWSTSDSFTPCAFSKDGKKVLIGYNLYEVESGNPIEPFNNRSNTPRSIAFFHSGESFLDGFNIWNLNTGTSEQPSLIIPLYLAHTATAVFSPNGRTILFASGRWGKKPIDRSEQRTPESGEISVGSVTMWDSITGKLLLTLPELSCPTTIAFSCDGKKIATGESCKYERPHLRVWSAQTGELLQSFPSFDGTVYKLSFSHDGQKIVIVHMNENRETAEIWDVETGKLAQQLTVDDISLTDISFSPDGKKVLAGDYTGNLKLWDADTGELLRMWVGHEKSKIQAVGFSPDGTIMASGGEDDMAKVWDVKTGQLLQTLYYQPYIYSLTFSPDGNYLLCGSHSSSSNDSGDVFLWDVNSGDQLVRFRGNHILSRSVAFSPDGGRIVTSGSDGSAKIWDVSRFIMNSIVHKWNLY